MPHGAGVETSQAVEPLFHAAKAANPHEVARLLEISELPPDPHVEHLLRLQVVLLEKGQEAVAGVFLGGVDPQLDVVGVALSFESVALQDRWQEHGCCQGESEGTQLRARLTAQGAPSVSSSAIGSGSAKIESSMGP